ncbi:MAG: U32 family peptidase, partial [Muribaculaceae bacterium]|nr:U32 family peptidase [Muribaculaceae bacterium]
MTRRLELLAPAGNPDIAIEAILHGADAVYMGASSHGARRNAANSIDDVKRVVDFAHIFRARVYVTVNTLVYDNEIKKVERLIEDLYHVGVDAIIVQDMGILRMDIPPIELHASTQCDIRTPEKARFLQDVGFSQLVLPRELTLEEIHKMSEAVDIPLESFVHGALCVSYSGRCHASLATCGRSANRGECAQLCRLPYTLKDSKGKTICKDKHLLSLRDLNTIDILPQLINAGVSSFKIEGRLKEVSYVKNTVASYRKAIDAFINDHKEGFERSSFGQSEVTFTPNLSKSFNRGFTHYFIERRRPQGIISPDTPKSLGEEIEDLKKLNNGDGISFFDAQGTIQ